MKKATKNQEEKKVFNAIEVDVFDEKTTFERVEVDEKKGVSKYPLAPGVTLTIRETDKDYDFGNINALGLSVNLTFRSGKNGMFASFPSVKNAKGEYVDLAGLYDKKLYKKMIETIQKHYEE